VRQGYSESGSYAGGHQGGHQGGDRYSDRRDGGPRYAPIPYHASPLEPVSHGLAHGAPRFVQAPPRVHVRPSQIEVAPPQVHLVDAAASGQHSDTGYAQDDYTPADPQAYQPDPVYIQAPADYYGDLPAGDAGEGYTYRQEPGERG
jgi:hypothetical protein